MNDGGKNSATITSPQAAYDCLRAISPETPCPYLPGLSWRSETYRIDRMDGALYERLMARGFRRCGRFVYRPRCRNCQACKPFRVSAADFQPTHSMRRVLRQNADVTVETVTPKPTNEKFAIYEKYLLLKHDDLMQRTNDSFVGFLYDTPTDTIEFEYRIGGRLVGVSIADCVPGGLSSVYMYFDPAFAARSPGTFSVLFEIDYCRTRSCPYYYLGYYVAGSQTMAYKSRFMPGQVLESDENWIPFEP